MKPFPSLDPRQRLDPQVVEQAMLWIVALQSGTSDASEHAACLAWRRLDAQHELAWQRLAGLGHGLRESVGPLPAAGARKLLQARGASSRRNVLKGLAGLGVVAMGGLSVRERLLLPELFSDYRTATGERRDLQLAADVRLQLDTHTALDIRGDAAQREVLLSLGRLLLEVGAGTPLRVRTEDGWVHPAPLSKLMISLAEGNPSGTRVQVLLGSAAISPRQGTSVQLAAGRQLLFDPHAAGPSEDLPASASAWTRGLLIAERMPLGQVVAELNRYRSGVLRCDPAVAALPVSGSLSLDRPDASLDLLARTLPIRIQRVLGYWASVVPA
ncbi:DUF4880 domain-containing protein [Pseudomonas sp. QD4]|uniref:DUF4880 domain-containing protein n=1 Tax=Pseudomonas sp. QD4 TaxID=3368618 RepID=UPI003B9EF705